MEGMKIKVKVMGTLIRPFGADEFDYDCPPAATVRQLLGALKYEPRHIPHIMACVNGELRHQDHALKAGDSVVLSVTVGGG
jgi:sulfur carrier protein ThiS